MQAWAGVAVQGNEKNFVGTTEGGLQIKQLICRLINLKEFFFRDTRHMSSPTTFYLPKPDLCCTHLPFPM